LQLIPLVAEAFTQERITASHANLIARLPQESRKRGDVAGLLIGPMCGCVHDFGCGHNLYEWNG
jgi:hypothetical protein